MRASIILCDFAEQEQPGGKVHMLGAGWSQTGPHPGPHAVVIFIKLARDEVSHPHDILLQLTDADGQPVSVPSPTGMQELIFNGKLTVSSPLTPVEADEANANFIISLQPLQLAGGQTYTWRLKVDADEMAAEGFYVLPAPRSAAATTTSGREGSDGGAEGHSGADNSLG